MTNPTTFDPSQLTPLSVQLKAIDDTSLPPDLKEVAKKRLTDAVVDKSGLTLEQKLRIAHDKVFRLHPITLAAVAARWKMFITDRTRRGQAVRTMATDGRSLFVNPTWAGKLSVGLTTCIVLHEICHVVFQHHFRFGKMPARDRDMANIAADLAINSRLMPEFLQVASPAEVSYLLDTGCFPRVGKYSHLPEGKSYEWYMAELRKERELKGDNGQRPENFAPIFEPGEGDDETEGDANLNDEIDDGGEIPDDLDRVIDEIIDRAEGERDGEGEGPGAGGLGGDDDGEFRPGTDNIFGDVEPYSEDDEELKDGERQFQEAVTAAIVTDKGWGIGGGWLETSLAEGVMPTDPEASKLNWKALLRDFLSKTCPQGYSYSRPSRRHGHRTDILLPARHSRSTAKGLIIVDTSISMGDAECDAALREVEAILTEYPRAEVKVISCDSRVILESEKVYTKDDFPLRERTTWKGRGGTNLAPAFEYAAKNAHEFEWVLCLSDMEWGYSSAPDPGKPVIWLSTRGDVARIDATIPFGVHAQVVI